MQQIVMRVLMVSALAVLLGCEAEVSVNDNSGGSAGNTVSGLTVTTATGGSVLLQGAFKTPCAVHDLNADGVDDSINATFEITGFTATSYRSEYYSDSSCSTANETIVYSSDMSLTAGADAVVTVWTDDTSYMNVVSPPASAADANILLPQASSFTILTAVVTQSTNPSDIGVTVDIGFVVDDSHAAGLKTYSAFFDGVQGAVYVDDYRTNY
ncbi:MAG: hypothetical protein OEY11_00990 [Gammaproteobacteria bacterium]|nr:hypothetical protein [Gammaproteobacteria bacterium]